jgi:hypothetical protein
MEALERRLLWRPRPERPLAERLRSFAEALLTLREQYYLGSMQSGSYASRIQALTEAILDQLEKRHGLQAKQADVPGRVSQLRHQVIEQLKGLAARDPRRRTVQEELDDLSIVVQLFSYRDDFTNERPSIERLAEILDKFEEDILGAPTASIHGKRRATICFGEPVPVPKERGNRREIRRLTETLEQQVWALLFSSNMPRSDSSSGSIRENQETAQSRWQSEEASRSLLR